jgi:hypothetical protein
MYDTSSLALLLFDGVVDFPWCGLLIDMSKLSVRVDYSRYRGNGECLIPHTRDG